MNICKSKSLLLFLIIFIIIFSLPMGVLAESTVIDVDKNNETSTSHIDYDGVNKGISDLADELGIYRALFVGVALLISVIILIVHFIRLALAFEHALHRKKVIEDIAITLFVIAMMGISGVIMLFMTSIIM